MYKRFLSSGWAPFSCAFLLLLAGCSGSSPVHRAPVEEHSWGTDARSRKAPTGNSTLAKNLPNMENAGKPGYYTVKPGDTLFRISSEAGQNWHEVMKWNDLANPNVIEVGQVLRVIPPGDEAAPTAIATKPITPPKIESRPLDAKAASTPNASASSNTTSAPAEDNEINWIWPASGTLIAPFNEARNKGLAIGGRAGDPIIAAADGKVVYAGSGLRGYGNLIIIKHNATFLSAYAHNQKLLVREEQQVRRGQKIAEMGSTEADGVQLHFEIRRQGRPVDPLKFLPAK